MTTTLLQLYNEVASQPWSMYDCDACDISDMEQPLIISINKALVEIWSSHPYLFRTRSYTITTESGVVGYELPNGVIRQVRIGGVDKYSVKLSGRYLDLIESTDELDSERGCPREFYVNDKICFYPEPDDRYEISVDYLTYCFGRDGESGAEIDYLSRESDELAIPEKYERIFKNAVINKSMMNALSSPTDENYAGYAIQYDKALKLLIKECVGLIKPKRIVF